MGSKKLSMSILSYSDEDSIITKFKNFVIKNKEELGSNEGSKLSFCNALLVAVENKDYVNLIQTIESYNDDYLFQLVFYCKLYNLCQLPETHTSESDDSCVELSIFPFTQNIYVLTIFDEYLYYISAGRAHISLADLSDYKSKHPVSDINFINVNRHNCKHFFWQNIIFIAVALEEEEAGKFIIHVYGFSLKDKKIVCTHILISNINICKIQFLVIDDDLLLIEKKFPITDIHAISLPQLLFELDKTFIFQFHLDNIIDNDHLSISRPIIFTVNKNYLIVLDANDPSSKWNLYRIIKQISVNDQGSINSKIKYRLQLCDDVEISPKNPPHIITDEGFLLIDINNNNKALVCLNSYHLGDCSLKIFISYINQNIHGDIMATDFKVINTLITFEKSKAYTLVHDWNIRDDIYYVLKWHIELFKKYPQKLYKIKNG